jgi:hypothetical protein
VGCFRFRELQQRKIFVTPHNAFSEQGSFRGADRPEHKILMCFKEILEGHSAPLVIPTGGGARKTGPILLIFAPVPRRCVFSVDVDRFFV